MKYVAFLLFGLAAYDTQPDAFYVREVTNPVMCQIEGRPIGCAYLVALYRQARDERRQVERGI